MNSTGFCQRFFEKGFNLSFSLPIARQILMCSSHFNQQRPNPIDLIISLHLMISLAIDFLIVNCFCQFDIVIMTIQLR